MSLKKEKTLVLLPGWTHDFQYETTFVRKLSKFFKVVTISYPGHSSSKENKKAQSMKYLAYLLKKVIENLKLKHFFLIGYSMGCQVVLKYISLYDQKNKVLLFSPNLESFESQIPFLGKVLLSSPPLLIFLRNFDKFKLYLVNVAYSQISKITEGSDKKESFKAGKVSLNGAFDTPIALLGDFTDPLKYKNQVNFVFGEKEILSKKLDYLGINYYKIRNAGHYPFKDNAQDAVKIIRDFNPLTDLS